MTPDAIVALGKALADPRTRVQAASVLLDRAWGKPLQAVITPDGNSPQMLHLLACQQVGRELREEREQRERQTPTIQHEPVNGHTFDLNAPPPLE